MLASTGGFRPQRWLSPRTIRGRVGAATFLLFALVLGFVCWSVDEEVREVALRSLDRRLVSEAEALAALTRFDGKKVELEFEDETMTTFSSSKRGAYFEVWTSSGLVERSRSLENESLAPPRPESFVSSPSARDARRPRPVIAVGPRGPVRLYTLAVPRIASTREDGGHVDGAPRVTIVVQVAHNMSEIDRAAGEVREALAISIPIALALGTLGSFLVARRATAPISRLSRNAAEIDPGSLDKRLDLSSVEGELLDLARTLNGAFDRLAGAVERERRFALAVAHELRTPLTITRGVLELAVARERLPADYQEAIHASLMANARLEALVASLLLLARAESSALRKKPVDLGAVVRTVVDSVAPEAQRAGVVVRASVPEAAAHVLGDVVLLERLIANLVENAIRHGASPEGIDVVLEVPAGAARVVVRDRGPGLPEDFVGRAFERFARADASRARASGGAGLGLSIVQAITRAHDAEVAARRRDGGGAEFIVTFAPLPTD